MSFGVHALQRSPLPPMAIAVRTLFFAAYRDLVGAAEIPVDLPEGSTVGDLVASLRERGHPFSSLPLRPRSP